MPTGTAVSPGSANAAPGGDEITSLIPKKVARARPLFDPAIVKRAVGDSFRKLHPRTMMKNPVMFVVEVGTVLTLVFTVAQLLGASSHVSITYLIALDVWLFLTVLSNEPCRPSPTGNGLGGTSS